MVLSLPSSPSILLMVIFIFSFHPPSPALWSSPVNCVMGADLNLVIWCLEWEPRVDFCMIHLFVFLDVQSIFRTLFQHKVQKHQYFLYPTFSKFNLSFHRVQYNREHHCLHNSNLHFHYCNSLNDSNIIYYCNSFLLYFDTVFHRASHLSDSTHFHGIL